MTTEDLLLQEAAVKLQSRELSVIYDPTRPSGGGLLNGDKTLTDEILLSHNRGERRKNRKG